MKEPKHMRDLHKIRKNISREWQDFSPEKKVQSIRKAAQQIELEIAQLHKKEERELKAVLIKAL